MRPIPACIQQVFPIPGTAWGRFLALPAIILISTVMPLRAEVTVTELRGAVQVGQAGMWRPANKGQALKPGSEIKTGRNSRCVLTFDDNSKVEIGPNGTFTLDTSDPKKEMHLGLGALRAWVTKSFSQRFVVRTPVAVCSVRGTEFGVSVVQNGSTSVDLLKGSLAVADNKGNEVLLKGGESIDVNKMGLGRVMKSELRKEMGSDKIRTAMKREVGLNMTKDEVQTAAALEQKNAIYQQGKAMIDVHGDRVRLEEYIIRPSPNQFKLVALDERADRFDYFFYLGTFNKILPDDLTIALRQMQGRPDIPPAYFLSSYQTGRSNTTDSVVENASGGHLVDVNNNGQAADAVTSALDPNTGNLLSLNVPNLGGIGNQPFYKPLFDNYTLAFNGVIHHSWTLAGGVTPYDGASAYNPANTTGAQNTVTHLAYTDVTNLVTPPNCSTTDNCTGYPDISKLHQTIYLENPGGTVWEKFDNYIISDQGKVANTSDFAGVTSGSTYKKLLLNWNFEQVITASEFGGRKIDLVVEPKILIQSGLVQ